MPENRDISVVPMGKTYLWVGQGRPVVAILTCTLLKKSDIGVTGFYMADHLD